MKFGQLLLKVIPLPVLDWFLAGWHHRYQRLHYLTLYEDEPADEFVETLRLNSDGSSFIDDSYFFWLNQRYEWRKGAEFFDPELYNGKIDPRRKERLLSELQNYRSIAVSLTLADVLEDEWRIWREDPDFPKPETIQKMGLDDLIANSYRWADGQDVDMFEESFDGAKGGQTMGSIGSYDEESHDTQ